MCLGIPGKLIEIERDDALGLSRGIVQFGNITREINLCYTPDVEVGDYVLVHVGFAISRLEETEATQTLEILDQLQTDTELKDA